LKPEQSAIPAATGLKQYRSVGIKPTEKIPAAAYTRPATEEQLLAALEEIGDGDGFDFDALDISLDAGPAPDADGDAAGLEPPAEEESS